MNKHTAIFLAEGFEEIEALTVVDLLRRKNITIDMVSAYGTKTVTGSHGITVEADCALADLKPDEIDMIILPGGMPGTKNLEACEPLQQLIRSFDEQQKAISAICAAPGILGRMGLLKGRKACSYPTAEDQLFGANVSREEVTKDGHILTSRGMGTAIPFGLAIVAEILGQEEADQLAKAIVFRV